MHKRLLLCHEKFNCYGFINKRSTAQFIDENTYFFATILCHHSYVPVSKFNFTLYISGMANAVIVFLGKSRPNVHIACKRNELSNILTTKVIFKKKTTKLAIALVLIRASQCNGRKRSTKRLS